MPEHNNDMAFAFNALIYYYYRRNLFIIYNLISAWTRDKNGFARKLIIIIKWKIYLLYWNVILETHNVAQWCQY